MLKLSQTSLALIIGNLIPIIGVLLFDWQLYPIVLIYWLENVVIGVYTVIKMLTCADDKGLPQRLFMCAFFCVHYGMFCFGHGTIIVDILGGENDSIGEAITLISTQGLYLALIALIISHGFSLLQNYFLGGEYKQLSLQENMFSPYKRVIVLHVFILFGAMVLQKFGQSVLGLVLLIVIKVIADLMAHKMGHKQTQQ